MCELTREQVEYIGTAIRESGYSWKHHVAYILETDAALRARLAEVEAELEATRLRLIAQEHSTDQCAIKLSKTVAELAAIQATVGDTEFALRARVAEVEREINSLKTCQCEGCDVSLEGEAYCTRCVTMRKGELLEEIELLTQQLAAITLTWTTAKPTSEGQ